MDPKCKRIVSQQKLQTQQVNKIEKCKTIKESTQRFACDLVIYVHKLKKNNFIIEEKYKMKASLGYIAYLFKL